MGFPLSRSIAGKMQDVLGYNLSSVVIQTGDEADALNRRFHSEAFTYGSEVYFRHGQYRPDSESGLELLAHELIHVCQQLSGRLPHWAAERMQEDEPLEREAQTLAKPIAALLSGKAKSVSSAEYSSLREFRTRPKRTESGFACHTVQCSAMSLVAAAQMGPPVQTPTTPGPTTCHEAAMGWLLTAENYQSPWKLMRYSTNTLRLPASAGSWLMSYVYANNVRISRADAIGAGNVNYTPVPGDILFTHQGGTTAMHSMIVVGVAGGNILIRGFNNAGTFNHPGVNPPAPPGAYDPNDRDISDLNLWDPAGWGFGPNNAGAHLCLVRYNTAAMGIRNALAHWTHSNFRGPLGGHGWKHTGGPPCPPSCPH